MNDMNEGHLKTGWPFCIGENPEEGGPKEFQSSGSDRDILCTAVFDYFGAVVVIYADVVQYDKQNSENRKRKQTENTERSRNGGEYHFTANSIKRGKHE